MPTSKFYGSLGGLSTEGTRVAVTRETCSEWLWDQTPELWKAIKEHPFLTELEAGELPDEKLLFYFEQNIQYVETVHRTRLIAAAKAPDADTMNLLTKDWTLEPREDQQARLLEAFGGRVHQVPPMAQACRGYTYHLWHNAMLGDTVDWLASFISCPWTYDKIGTHVAGRLDEKRRVEWTEWYGSEEHHALLADLRASLDRLSANLDESRWQELLEKWRIGMRYEWMFWDDAYHMRSWPI
jgi:thiaminase/transcriptional activator TenA